MWFRVCNTKIDNGVFRRDLTGGPTTVDVIHLIAHSTPCRVMNRIGQQSVPMLCPGV